ncbi:MAG: extracellular solute-binding protein [Butyrivibrio sp.]|nr:extracellular solute-binding protein [Acetatifactor muris]MCM1558163.1 extracellular solute-binding protein [Butyrivibrio sp.]
MKKGFKRILTAGLAALTALSLAACDGDDGKAAGDRFVYVPEYISIGEENMQMSDMACADGKLYFSSYVYDEETGTSSYPLFQYDIETGELQEMKVDMGDDAQDTYIQDMVVDGDGNLYLVLARSFWDENNPDNWHRDTLLSKYDTTGSNVFLLDITKEMNSDDNNTYIQNMIVDGEGRIYLVSDSIIRLYDSEGAYRGNVEIGDYWLSGAVRGKNGRVYVAYNDWNTGDGYVAAEIDFDGKKLGDPYTIQADVDSLSEGLEKDFLINDRVRLYEYDTESGTQEELLNWLDCDINGDYVQLVCPAGDGRLMAVIRDWESGDTEIALFTKTKASQVAKKEELVVGTLSMSQELRSTVVAFNKSNEKYHVTIKEYYDSYSDMDYSDAVTNLNNELVSGSGLDLLALDSSDNIDVGLLAEKGILADLNPYLDNSSAVSRDAFIDSVLRGNTYGDILVSIPRNFTISTVAGKTSQVGDKMGWSIRDIMELSKANPDADLFEYANKAEMMRILMTFNQDSFIDWEKGTCNFDSEEFRQMLEFVAGFPSEFDWSEDQESAPVRLASGKLLLMQDSVSNYYDIQVTSAMFNEPVTYVGFPTTDGSVGCVMRCNGGYCIIDKSKYKDAAWEFIEFYLNRDTQMFSWGFPSRQEKLEEEIKEACTPNYRWDENGEIMKDENGNPIEASNHGYSYGSDWSYDCVACTEEEMAVLRELIDVAKPMPAGNSQILAIISEEAEAFYQGQKSLDEVVSTIQSRASMYVGENS